MDGNLANLHWWLLLAGLFVAADRAADDRTGWTLLRGAWLVITCLSEALAPTVAAAYLVGIVLRRQRRGGWSRVDLGFGAAVAVAAAVQVVNSVIHPRLPVVGDSETLSAVWRFYRLWVLDWGWGGPTSQSRTVGEVVINSATAVGAAGLIAFAIRRGWSSRFTPVVAGLVLALGSFGALGVSVFFNLGMVPRYAFLPFALVVLALVVVLHGLFAGMRWTSAAAGITVFVVLGGLLVLDPFPPRVSTTGPGWRDQVEIARQSCRAPGSTGGTRSQVTIAPQVYSVYVPCWRLPK